MRPVSLSAIALAAVSFVSVISAPVVAQPLRTDSASRLSIDRLFKRGDFAVDGGPEIHWLKDGRSYVDVRPAARGSQIVKVDVITGALTVLADARVLTDENGAPIEVEELSLSRDESKALLFHNSVRVWRKNTRGVYHVLDFATQRVTPLVKGAKARSGVALQQANGKGSENGLPSFLARGLASGAVDPDLQMFAKFSPDGRQVAYVRGNNLWATDLASGEPSQLTTDGSDDIINGTTDWVYEEELGLQDAFRWSPDARHIAYWRFDQSLIPAMPIVNETESVYPVVAVERYPKAGFPNSAVKVGVVDLGSKQTRWLAAGPDTGQYIVRMEWTSQDSVAVLRLPRRQTRLDVLMLSATSGQGRTIVTERDSAYVDVEGEAVTWINDNRQFLLRSDRSGWRQYFLYNRDGSLVRQVTRDGMDVREIARVDEAGGNLYVVVAGPSPTQSQLFRFPLASDASSAAGVQVTKENGTHDVTIAPGARYAVDVWSSMGVPPTVRVLELPSFTVRRTMADNADVKARLARLTIRAPEFIKVPMPDGMVLDGYRITPAGFDSTKHYPVLMHLYGGPAAPQVLDQWGDRDYLWHQMLAQNGYVIVVVDNRGAAFRGREFRKITQLHLGLQESQDQIDAAKWVARQPWADASRIGMWGWSYGGYMTALTLSRAGKIFKSGIVVAPVTDWRFYDTIYTERYMWTPQENRTGYERSAVFGYLPGLTARLLLVFGSGDDNVHPQNSMTLANALERYEKDFTMLVYPNRTHSISGGNTQAHLFASFTRFVLENL